MKLKTVVENTAISHSYKKKHGLCVYLETEHHKILFDLGPDETFMQNARKLHINISDIDTVIISHGHTDHGGALKIFLENNHKAKVYIHKDALNPYFTKIFGVHIYVGLDPSVKDNDRIIFVEDQYRIDDELFLFANIQKDLFLPKSNRALFKKEDGKFVCDNFSHEQNLLVTQSGSTYLFTGCSHNGITNIMNAAMHYTNTLDYVIGGFHLFNPTTRKAESIEAITQLAQSLKQYDASYFTCHCTGQKAFHIMKKILGEHLNYLSTGTSLTI